jgi:hypothetical protein
MLHDDAMLHVFGQLLEASFPHSIHGGLRHWRERCKGVDGSKGLPEITNACGARAEWQYAIATPCNSLTALFRPTRGPSGWGAATRRGGGGYILLGPPS